MHWRAGDGQYQDVDALLDPSGTVTLTLSLNEAVVVHERLASAEWADDLETIELPDPASRTVMSDLQQALAPLIPTLGTAAYGSTVRQAVASIVSGSHTRS